MLDAQNVGPDGIPIFNMYVKSAGGAGMWYPCGSFKGDESTKSLVDSQDGFLGGLASKQLEQGVSSSLYDSLGQLTESVVRSYPQLKKVRKGGGAAGAKDSERTFCSFFPLRPLYSPPARRFAPRQSRNDLVWGYKVTVAEGTPNKVRGGGRRGASCIVLSL